METVWLLYDKDENDCEIFLLGCDTEAEAKVVAETLRLLKYNVVIHEAVVWNDPSTIEE
jgi:hypothetical protein